MPRILCIVAFSLLQILAQVLAPAARAVEYVWSAPSDGVWVAPSNWAPNGVPDDASDTARFNGTSTKKCVIDSDLVVGNIIAEETYTGPGDEGTLANDVWHSMVVVAGNRTLDNDEVRWGEGVWEIQGQLKLVNLGASDPGSGQLLVGDGAWIELPGKRMTLPRLEFADGAANTGGTAQIVC